MPAEDTSLSGDERGETSAVRWLEHELHCRFCKKSLICVKRINNPFVLLVRFVI